MPRFFTRGCVPENGVFVVTGDDARHISRSLRMRTGENIYIVCGGRDFLCEIKKITDSEVYAEIKNETGSNEPTVFVTLFQALPKQDKLESIIQKSVELGVSEIVPVLTKRCISRPEPQQFNKKIDRMIKISESAAKQSGRGIIPEISGIISFDKCLEEITKCDMPLICYEKNGGVRLSSLDFNGIKTVGILIGPEGGFDQSEAEAAVKAGVRQIYLGNRILRCETAPLAAVSVIMSLTGNM